MVMILSVRSGANRGDLSLRSTISRRTQSLMLGAVILLLSSIGCSHSEKKIDPALEPTQSSMTETQTGKSHASDDRPGPTLSAAVNLKPSMSMSVTTTVTQTNNQSSSESADSADLSNSKTTTTTTTTTEGGDTPPLIVSSNQTLSKDFEGSVLVKAGHFVLAKDVTISGNLSVQRGASASIEGTQSGSVDVERGAALEVMGDIEGSVSISEGSSVIIQPSGKLAGSLENDGSLVIRGVFGGSQTGSGKVSLEGHGHIKKPTIEDGMNVYRW